MMKKTIGSLLIAAVTVLILCHPGWKGGEAVAQRYWTADVAGMENIRMHGAKGDGKTDDTQALLSAIAAAETGRGGNVYLPEGTYRIGSGVTVPYEVELYFDVGGVLCPDRDVKLNSALSLQTSIRRSTGLPKRSFLPAGGISSGTAATAFTICRMIFI